VLQRVKSASVTVDGQLISSIGKGLLVLAAISKDDTESDVESMAGKILKAKLWDDQDKEPPAKVGKSVQFYVFERLIVGSGKRPFQISMAKSFVVWIPNFML
jgi:D-Tyr-tRNAtyr deacylase